LAERSLYKSDMATFVIHALSLFRDARFLVYSIFRFEMRALFVSFLVVTSVMRAHFVLCLIVESEIRAFLVRVILFR